MLKSLKDLLSSAILNVIKNSLLYSHLIYKLLLWGSKYENTRYSHTDKPCANVK